MFFKKRKNPNLPGDVDEKSTERILRADDDLLERARVIIWSLGWRGAVGDKILQVHDILEKYAALDDAATPSGPPRLKLVPADRQAAQQQAPQPAADPATPPPGVKPSAT